ncbi:MAG: hypothetical protein KGJ72_09505, partial [Gammaproteobacteria bacterium]|nr:hypothetical protein [Gammaproteobacteria bacterium]
MATIRHVGRLAAVAGAASALLMLTSPARAHAGVDTGSAIFVLASTASAAMSSAMRGGELVSDYGPPGGDFYGSWKPVHHHRGTK